MQISTTISHKPIGWTDYRDVDSMAAIIDATGAEWRLVERAPGELTLSLARSAPGGSGQSITVHPHADNSITVTSR